MNDAKIPLGEFPTPVEKVEALSTAACDLWVKRDDRTSSVYGGNKVRKLEHLFADARAKGKSRILTVGAAGSHHVLATVAHGARHGFAIDAILGPQPRTAHAESNLRAGLHAGLHATPCGSYATMPLHVLAEMRSDSYYVPAGGSNAIGSRGYVDAVVELRDQIARGEMPDPDMIVVTLGSGGTAAGICVGLEMLEMKARLVAVSVADPAPIIARYVVLLAAKIARKLKLDRVTRARIEARIEIDRGYLGPGYGIATDAGEAATRRAAEATNGGLVLDPTYTSKTFAAVLDRIDRAERSDVKTILYWHTLSSAPKDEASRDVAIDPALMSLFR